MQAYASPDKTGDRDGQRVGAQEADEFVEKLETERSAAEVDVSPKRQVVHQSCEPWMNTEKTEDVDNVKETSQLFIFNYQREPRHAFQVLTRYAD